MVAVMPLAVAWVDLLPVGADEGLLPADPAVRDAALAGTPKAQIAREHGLSRSTLYRYLKESAGPDRVS